MNLPGFRLHPLRGDRRAQWAVSVSGNWRVVFEFDGPDATNVDLGGLSLTAAKEMSNDGENA